MTTSTRAVEEFEVFEDEEAGHGAGACCARCRGASLELLEAGATAPSLADERTLVLARIRAGTRDESELTNQVFFARHPELPKKPLARGQEALMREWLAIRRDVVRPALRSAADTTTRSTDLGLAPGTSVLLVGDSHTHGPFGTELERLLGAAGLNVVRQAKIGSAVKYWLPLLPGLLRKHRPEVVIVALGANMRGYPSASGTSAHVKSAVDLVRKELPAARLVWIGPPRQRGDSDAQLAKFNDILRRGLDTATRFVDSARHTPRYEGRDGVHYAATTAQSWARGVFAELGSALTKELEDELFEDELFEDELFEDELFEGGAPADIEAFAARLGEQWSKQRGGDPTPEAMTKWLLSDYRDTLEGARKRYKKLIGRKVGRDDYSIESIGRAWRISREANMKFQAGFPGVALLGKFDPPAEKVALVKHADIPGSDESPVAPILVSFVKELKRRHPVTAKNYPGHGGGSFQNRGYSLDLYIAGRDDRGFYPRDAAVKFLRALHEAAVAVGTDWRVIYNDYDVASIVNRGFGRQHVIYGGHPVKSGGVAKNINWHGPSPLILHFHLDLTPARGASTSRWNGAPLPAPAPTPRKPAPIATTAGAKTVSADVVRFAQRVLNLTENERLGVDGIAGAQTRAAVDRFRRRYDLGAGGLDATVDLALVQRSFEELAQQSIFARVGARDPKTDQALARFRSERGLGAGATLDAATRAALTQALTARSSSAKPKSPPPSPKPQPKPTAGPHGGGVDAAVVARIDRHRALIDDVAKRTAVSASLIRGIIAAESSGHPNTGAGTSGYKGIMQCGTTAAHLTPEVSVKCGAEKYVKFAASMRRFFKQTLKQDFDALPEETRIRLVTASYNAGPGTVQLAIRFAAAGGDAGRWLAPEHYVRAVLSTGAYSTASSRVAWCATNGRMSAEDLARDLSRLSGKPLDALRAEYAPKGNWEVKKLAGALPKHLFAENAKHRNAGTVSLDDLRARATKALFCTAQFKQAHTQGYMDTILRYKRFFDAR